MYQPVKATSLHISLSPPPVREQLNKPKTVLGSCAKSKLLPLLFMGTVSKRIWCLWSTMMLKHGKDKEVKGQDTKQRDSGRKRRKKKKVWIEQYAFLEGIASISTNTYNWENIFHYRLLKISKSLKYNMNGIIQETFTKAEQEPEGVKWRQHAHGRTKTLSSVLCHRASEPSYTIVWSQKQKRHFLAFTWQCHSFQTL